MSQRVVFTAVRNEAPFLVEWVAFHLMLGFDRVVAYSNNCTDGTDELLDELSRHVPLQHTRHDPKGLPAQPHAAELFLQSGAIADGDWLMWLDADEYLNIHAGDGMLQDLIDAIGTYFGMPIPWRLFGDSHHTFHPGRQISSAFTWADLANRPGVRMVKTLFRVDRYLQEVRIHAPRMAPDFWRQPYGFLSSTGDPVSLSNPAIAKWAAGGPILLQNEDTSHRIAQVNHYLVRTKAAFALRYERGSGAQGFVSREQARQAHALDRFPSRNHNTVRDDTILRYERALDDAIERLLMKGQVRALHERAWADFQAHERRFYQHDPERHPVK